MEDLRPDLIRFAIHSPLAADDPNDTRVSAAVFAAKLGALVRALKAADKAVNRVLRHDYTIAKLHTSTPTALLRESLLEDEPFGPPVASGISAFSECTHAIQAGEADYALKFGDCASNVVKLATGAGKTFSYAEAATSADVVRIDPFLKERATFVTGPEAAKRVAEPAARWFKGIAHSTFVGAVKEVDLRGSLPAIKLVLSAGGKQIDCVCRGLEVGEIREALNRRVRVTGQAIYDGKSGLPRRVEVSRIEHFKADPDFSRWGGSFKPFTPPEWSGDEH